MSFRPDYGLQLPAVSVRCHNYHTGTVIVSLLRPHLYGYHEAGTLIPYDLHANFNVKYNFFPPLGAENCNHQSDFNNYEWR